MSQANKPSGHIKSEPADWRVYECLADEFSDQGEHAYFYVEKTSFNTADVATLLADALQLKRHDIGYAGLKDKHAITRQWFSVPVPSDIWPLAVPGIECLDVRRHIKKLRRGDHQGNYFEIRLSQTEDIGEADLESLGCVFANYFGPQRTSSNNYEQASTWLAAGQWGAEKVSSKRRRGKPKADGRRGWHLSVLRSVLFNAVLERRVALGNYAVPIAGDVLLNGVPSAPLWGRGRSAASEDALAIEQAALSAYTAVCEGLEYAGVSQGRRSMSELPRDFVAQSLGGNDILLKFTLNPGAYATTLLADKLTVIDDSLVR